MPVTRVRLTSASARDTSALGRALAALLAPGDLVLLRGDLGAGKTTLARAVAGALGVDGPVVSPTFTIAQRYAGRVPVLHVDAYRLGSPDDEELGLVLDGAADSVTLMEWPESLASALPDPALTVDIAHGGGDRRLIALAARDADLGPLVDHLRARHIDAEPEPGAAG